MKSIVRCEIRVRLSSVVRPIWCDEVEKAGRNLTDLDHRLSSGDA